MPLREKPAWIRYAIATGFLLAFAMLSAALSRHLHDYSFFLFIPAVFLSSLLLGRGPGWWCTILGSLLAVGPFSYPASRLTITDDDVLPLALFVLTCLGMSQLGDALRRALKRAVAAEERHAMLLRETEHRTKNNFQIIGSVLST